MTVGTKSRSLELFFVDGRPDGILTAREFNWTGHVLATPRTQLSEALKRKEADYTGVYLLIGEKEGKPFAYIGEADNIGNRIRNHDIKKDWWTSAILISSADNKLNKAHVRYLEARLISLAERIKKVTLDNGTSPPIPLLTESEEANMEAFLDNALIVLPALRIDFFVDDARPDTSAKSNPKFILGPSSVNSDETSLDSPVFEIQANESSLSARARQIDGRFVVEKGSAAALEWVQKGSYPSYRALFDQLIGTGILQKEGEHRIFGENYAFKSASAAASVVKGRPWSGPSSWMIKGEEKTLKEWEEERARNKDNPDG